MKYKNLIFFSLLILLYVFLDYPSILFSRPHGIHFIRQTDGLSFVANYCNNGNNIFEPQVFNLTSTSGRAACEFPILYYITAQLYKIFGEQEFILRLITIMIVSFGFLFLFKLLNLILRDVAYSMIFTFLFLSSTVLLYYTNNFLPDASALGFTLIGWYYFYLCRTRLNFSLIFSFLFFTLSSLIKVTYFINPVAAMSSVILLDMLKNKKIIEIFKSHFRLLVLFFVTLTLVFCWNLYAVRYNAANNDNYFLVGSRPIWEMERKGIFEVWDYITNYWYSAYYYQSVFHFFGLTLLFGLLFINKSKRILLVPCVILFLGSFSYILLFYAQFKDHDYYFITTIPTIIILVITGFTAIRDKFTVLINNPISKLLLLILVVLSVKHAKAKLESRYEQPNDQFAKIGRILSGTRNKIDSLGIHKNAKVVVFTDKTANGGLYFLNRKGWNIGDTTEADINKIKTFRNSGAEYLVNITNMKFTYPKIFDNSKVSIYKLD